MLSRAASPACWRFTRVALEDYTQCNVHIILLAMSRRRHCQAGHLPAGRFSSGIGGRGCTASPCVMTDA
jgi:hypothetical protein